MKKIHKILLQTEKKRNQAPIRSACVKPGFIERMAEKFEASAALQIWIRINQSATILALVVALIGFGLAYKRYGEDNRKHDEDRVARAWDVVIRMAGKQSNGGQVSALERLVADGVHLGQIDLHNTYLAKASLKGADFNHANLSSVDLSGADLRSANLSHANLSNALLNGADLSNANFENADLTGAQLIKTTLDISVIFAGSLRQADLTGVQFVYVDDNGEEQWDAFNDTFAEASAADNRQNLMNGACADASYQKPQHTNMPFTLSYKKCHRRVDYKKFFLWQGAGRVD